MKFESIQVDTGLSVPSHYSYRSHEDQPDCLAVILPGQGYTRDSPLLWYSALAAFQAGCDTVGVEYGFQAAGGKSGDASLDRTVKEVQDFLVSFMTKHGYRKLILVSKSIGTVIAATINLSPLKVKPEHIFLTPLKETLDFILKSPRILVLVGENDPFFGSNDINLISDNENVHVETFRSADHILEVRGDYALSIRTLGRMADAVHDYCKHVR